MPNQTHCPCDTVVFSAVASGTGPFSYVWRKDGVLLSGETNSSLIIPRLQASTNLAVYSVEATGACNSATNNATLTVESGPSSSPATFANTGPILMNGPMTATPYPATMNLKCLLGTVQKMTVTLSNLGHAFPDDIDIMLAGPNGKTVMLMSDTGGRFSLTNVTLTFDDASLNLLPDATRISAGVYKPTDFESGDFFPAAAPGGPYPTSLSVFNGISPNGLWSLYVVDDATLDDGAVAGGWSMTLWLDIVQPNLSGPSLRPDGNFEFTLSGPAGRPIIVEASANLQTWLAIGTNILSGAATNFVDRSPASFPHRFYRAVQCP
jgi:hypothetical protein